MTGFANDHESMFYVRNEPETLDWSPGKVNVSRLIVPGQVTAMRLMVIGSITWNGMLPTSRDDDGPVYPVKPKVSIKCLRDGDLLHIREIVNTHSVSSKAIPLLACNLV